MRNWRYAKLALILLVLFRMLPGEADGQSGAACQTSHSELKVSERSWWRYYERGLDYAKLGCWQEAVQDFQTALNQRPRDIYRARTQGLNFIAYFPHRELGIAYYHLGRYAEAIRELKTSLKQTAKEGERARKYLRLAQQAIAEQPASTRSILRPCEMSRKPLVDFNWWNYYQRGAAYSDKKCWREAVKDFQAAIAQRPQDAHRARTTGLRFIPYFPHRELGIVYYYLGQYDKAVRALKTSLAYVAKNNERAEEFLSRAQALNPS
ncbi:tetratricopeptide repeat protein [Candidatus Entotheonella palauensis]|uniref:tetratricopeptide repeat protein n=1 Tax=Candidatus Entotheonella palauensis TaxID=93172 RepID=UPI000B7E3BD0|nr:tetratricopeptide repeat protein [Candidatus Entotheonella palauensis]